MNEVSGEFDVKIVPVDTGDDKMGMMTLDKQYHGDLNATGQGRMLTGMTDVKGSAAYVAIERVNGKLKGARGNVSHPPHGSHEQRVAIAGHSRRSRLRDRRPGRDRRRDAHQDRRRQALLSIRIHAR